MPSKTGIAHVKNRLINCPDLASLRRVWDGIGYDYARHPEIIELKDRLKAQMSHDPRGNNGKEKT